MIAGTNGMRKVTFDHSGTSMTRAILDEKIARKYRKNGGTRRYDVFSPA